MVEMFYEDENFKKQMKCRSEMNLIWYQAMLRRQRVTGN